MRMELPEASEESLAVGQVYVVLYSLVKKGIITKTTGRPHDGLVWISEGECKYVFTDGTVFIARPNTLFYLAKDSIYTMYTTGEPYSGIFIDFDFLRANGEEFVSGILPIPNDEQTDNRFLHMVHAWTRKRTGYRLECKAALYEVLSSVLQQRAWRYIAPENKRLAEDAASYITEHYAEPELTVAMLSNRTRVSEAYFRRLFKEAFGVSPAHYLADVRIRQAKNLLQYGEQSVSEIAEQCGYANVYYFSRVFHEKTGLTPTEYAAQARPHDA